MPIPRTSFHAGQPVVTRVLSKSGTIAVSDILGFIAVERRHRQERADQATVDVISAHWPLSLGRHLRHQRRRRARRCDCLSGLGPPAGHQISGHGRSHRRSDPHLVAPSSPTTSPPTPLSHGFRRHAGGDHRARAGRAACGSSERIDVESDKLNAFGAPDQKVLEDCARALAPLWADG